MSVGALIAGGRFTLMPLVGQEPSDEVIEVSATRSQACATRILPSCTRAHSPHGAHEAVAGCASIVPLAPGSDGAAS